MALDEDVTGSPMPMPVQGTETSPDTRGAAEGVPVLTRLSTLAREQEQLQDQLALLRNERDALILRGLAHGVSSTELAAASHLTGARVRAIADAAASSSARERVAHAVARIMKHKPALCTTYGALATAVGIGSAKGVASSLATNPDVSAREGARVLLLRWASPAIGGYVIPTREPTWQTQGSDTASRLECLRAESLAVQAQTPDGPIWYVPFERVCADAQRLTQLIAD